MKSGAQSPMNILVVEDDEALRDALLITLEAAGYRVSGADGGPAALALIEREAFQMVVSDLRMAPMDGLQLLGEIRLKKPGLPVLLMTAFGDVDKAVAAMRGGACDFMLKPFEPKALLDQIERYAVPPAAEGVVAVDARTRDVLLLAARVARTDATVLLSGESGTGKEVFARYIHDQSQRSKGPFVAINCAAIPDTLLEATLFGYEKGAFTGAQNAQAGKFEQANGGTLLLDEISEMPLGLQAKLLRVLQEREVERVGGKKPVPVDIRVLATSNRNMTAEVAAGRFREDLFYRLNVFPLAIPSLRERPGDIVPLARHFLAMHGARLGRVAKIDAGAAAKLAAHPWPGNVRELENVMQRALILAPGEVIETEHLLLPVASGGVSVAAPFVVSAPVAAPAYGAMTADAVPPAPTFASAPSAQPAVSTAIPANMKDLERQHILETLAKVGGSRKKAIELLGISERTLRYKLKQYREEGLFNDGENDE
jgi:two-component system response regulator FlrC